MKGKLYFYLLFSFLLLGVNLNTQAQAVAVTARFDTNQIAFGGVTTFRVFAQVVPSLRPSSDRIFSWYLDVLNLNSNVVAADYNTLIKTASDNDPGSSSAGTSVDADRHGIYDTFLDLPGAGIAQPVEILSFRVTGATTGKGRIQVRAGTGVPSLAHDFIVAPSQGGSFFSGGDYTIALDELEVLEDCKLRVLIGRPTSDTVELTFTPCVGFTHTVEWKTELNNEIIWQPLPNAPHDSGKVTVPNPLTDRFYRVRRDPIIP